MKQLPLVGTSGFGVGIAKYFDLFSCVEVQHTFYQPPKISTLEKWRAAAPTDFEFVIKAWQLITHEAKSPTHRRLKRELSEKEKSQAGSFKSSVVVRDAWHTTLAAATALQARTILFQCPASFKQTRKNISNLKKFFQTVERKNDRGEPFNFCWEPRGDWDREVVTELCEALDLCHVVDPFVNRTCTPERTYFRLHGRNGWRYDYEDHELRELVEMLGQLPNSKRRSDKTNPDRHTAYVFFNNARMTENASSFQALIKGNR